MWSAYRWTGDKKYLQPLQNRGYCSISPATTVSTQTMQRTATLARGYYVFQPALSLVLFTPVRKRTTKSGNDSYPVPQIHMSNPTQ